MIAGIKDDNVDKAENNACHVACTICVLETMVLRALSTHALSLPCCPCPPCTLHISQSGLLGIPELAGFFFSCLHPFGHAVTSNCDLFTWKTPACSPLPSALLPFSHHRPMGFAACPLHHIHTCILGSPLQGFSLWVLTA